ncbi:MAG: DUF4174 domain-containing protein [Spirochaetes bacterium]|nr:DUF4174 domain-containing protein [Spirochaetota bacterium]
MSAGGNDALGARTALDGFSLDAGGREPAAAPETANRPHAAEELEELPGAGRSRGNGIGGAIRSALGEAGSELFAGRRGLDSTRVLNELGSATHLLDVLSVLQHEFTRNYEKALAAVRETGLPAAVCTVYDSIPHLEARYRTALSVFNDHIIIRATVFGFPVIDLRAVCSEEADCAPASPIEPSDAPAFATNLNPEAFFRDPECIDSLRDKYGVDGQQFVVLLIGKDGGVKLRAEEPVTTTELFSLIDSMPMRRREIRE